MQTLKDLLTAALQEGMALARQGGVDLENEAVLARLHTKLAAQALPQGITTGHLLLVAVGSDEHKELYRYAVSLNRVHELIGFGYQHSAELAGRWTNGQQSNESFVFDAVAVLPPVSEPFEGGHTDVDDSIDPDDGNDVVHPRFSNYLSRR